MEVRRLQEFKTDDDTPKEKESTAPTIYKGEEYTKPVYAEVVEAKQGTNDPATP